MKLARCARSDSHSVRALRAVKSHPCGAGLHSHGRGAAPVLDCWFAGSAAQTQYKMFLRTSRGVKCGACCEVCWGGPTSFETLQRMPVEDLCRRFRVSLVCDVYTQAVQRRTSAFLLTHLVGSFASHALRASLMLSFLFMTKRAHICRKPFSTYVGPHFLLEQHQQRGAAEGATQNRAGIPVHAPHGPGVRRRAVRAGRFPICCGLLLTRSPAPRRDVVRPLEKSRLLLPLCTFHSFPKMKPHQNEKEEKHST